MRANLRFGAATAAFVMLGLAPAAMAQDSDPAGDASTQARLTSGQAASGEISPAGDADWYRLHVELGQRYAITLDGVADASGNAIDPTLGIYDSSGNQLAFNDDANGSLNSALNYTPSQSGEVFVEARAFSSEAAGAYTLNVTDSVAPPDDVGNDASTRGRISAGRTVTGELETEGDVDWYRLSARTGQRYRIALNGADANGVGDPLLRVVDRAGNELAVADDSEGSLNPLLEWTPQANGDVFLEAGGYGGAYTGGYTLSVSAGRAPRDGISADVYTHGRIGVGRTLNGMLDFAGDRDWYRVNLEQGQSYHFTLVSTGDSPLSDPLIKIYNRRGEEVAMDDDGGEGLNSYLEFTAPESGAYYVEARGFGDDATGAYAIAAAAGDIPADTSTDVSVSADGDYREGVLSPNGDQDWFRVTLAEGQAIRVALNGGEGGDALGDPLVAIHGPDGVEIMRDDDSGDGLNAWLEFQAPSAGDYFIAAQGFSPDAAGRYTITVTAGEIGASPDTADYLAPNSEGRVSLISGPDDVDWFAVELIEGRPYRFMLDGTDPGPLADPMLTLYDGEGNQVASDDDGGTGVGSYLTYYSTTSGIYFAAVSGYGGATGRYFLRATDTDVPGQANTDEMLDANGDDRISRIDIPGDMDSYQVTLEAGVTYTIEVKGHGDDTLADPFLAILDSSGERVTSDDDSGPGLDARLRFAPENGGPYFLQASGLGGSTGWYQISIVRQ